MISRYLKWLFWTVVYAFRRRPKGFFSILKKALRCRRPWWKFRPSVYHNDEGREWEVFLANEDTYTRRCCIPDCEVAISRETGHVIGVTLYDEILRQPDAFPEWFGPNKNMEKIA